MMKTILITLLSLLLISCGSVTKNKYKNSEELSGKTILQKDENLSTATQSFENGSVRIENSGYKIAVKPIAGQNSFFNFTSPDGQVFKGETNAELNFEKVAEKKEIRIEKIFFSQIIYKSQTTYKSHTTYKTVTKHSEKVKIYSSWYLFLIAGFLLSYLLKLFWSWVKKSNWFTIIYNRLSLKNKTEF
ncbi:hypothetical protein AB670_02563 [Chryseobacterium sp. MOF25P]|nr:MULTISPECIES: hypothetical protein [unclassified Chryseobacterium]MBO6184562.1 hypothetical protein [Chryseobacterium sp.]OBW41112.1 hypothetical protein AB670_02563 [Chryseobacterium sp. MOF25P]OBW45758.1 hypothetical protein AB671_02166 [Chryseobacterium sp. BGARF1]